MTKAEAQIKADEYLAELQTRCPFEVAFNYEAAEEHSLGFVFFYNSAEFLRSRDFSHALAGNGPLLVLRTSGEVIALPSYQSMECSLRELASTLES